MKPTGRGQFNRKQELVGNTCREVKFDGFDPLTDAPSPKDNVPAYSPKVQLRDEKMSDNASVKTTTKGTR